MSLRPPVANDGAGSGSAEESVLRAADRPLARDLLRYLQEHASGEQRAKRVDELSEALGCSARKVRTLVTTLRESGKPILATPNAGYFWPAERSEAKHTLSFLRQRIETSQAVKRGIERGLEEAFGPVRTLFSDQDEGGGW